MDVSKELAEAQKNLESAAQLVAKQGDLSGYLLMAVSHLRRAVEAATSPASWEPQPTTARHTMTAPTPASPSDAGQCPAVYEDLHKRESCTLPKGHSGKHSYQVDTTPTTPPSLLSDTTTDAVGPVGQGSECAHKGRVFLRYHREPKMPNWYCPECRVLWFSDGTVALAVTLDESTSAKPDSKPSAEPSAEESVPSPSSELTERKDWGFCEVHQRMERFDHSHPVLVIED